MPSAIDEVALRPSGSPRALALRFLPPGLLVTRDHSGAQIPISVTCHTM